MIIIKGFSWAINSNEKSKSKKSTHAFKKHPANTNTFKQIKYIYN